MQGKVSLEEYAARFHVEYRDINIDPFRSGTDALDDKFSKFDAVMADGAPFGTAVGFYQHHLTDLLVRSEIVMALDDIKPDRTLVLLLHRLDNLETANIFTDLQSCWKKVRLFKPTTSYRHSTSFYAIAEGLDPSEKAAVKLRERSARQWREKSEVNLIMKVLRSTDEHEKAEGVRKLMRLVEIDGRTSNDAMDEQARADVEDFWEIFGEGLTNLAEDSKLWAIQTAGLKTVQKLAREHAANLQAEKARANLTGELDLSWR